VKKFDNTGEDVDDLISIGTIGLIKAINTFDLAKKIRLATYAARCIENEILMHLRSTRRIRAEVSLYDPIGVDKEGNDFTLTVYLFRPLNPCVTWVKSGITPAENHRRAGAFLCDR
jgi:RNA polymerase sporulation-specific sigma factor